MKKRVVDLRHQQSAILDIASYGRGGQGRFTQAQVDQIARTVGRAPEVMVKVSGGAHTLRGVATHLAYIGRDGDLAMETDMGDRVQQRGFQKALIEDWDLDLEARWHPTARDIRGQRKSTKLVHNIIFSMPPGTPPQKVLKAVRKLATEEWALKHRYAMVLHTDDAHPHVHVVLKARSEQGERLNIRKATLRAWRQRFASNLRELGVEANATERAVRGETRIRKSDGAFRAAQRGVSVPFPPTWTTPINGSAAQRLTAERLDVKRLRTQKEVVEGWHGVSERLRVAGHADLSARVDEFVEYQLKTKTGKPPVDLDIKPIERTRGQEIESLGLSR